MVFPLSNPGFNPMGTDGLPSVAPAVEPMGEMILPGVGSGIDPFGFTNSQVSRPGEPGLTGMGWGSSAMPSLQAAGGLGPGVAPYRSPYGMPGMQGYCAPPSSGQNSSLSQVTALLDFMKGIFSGIMFSKLSNQMFSGGGGIEHAQEEDPEVVDDEPPTSSGTPGGTPAGTPSGKPGGTPGNTPEAA